MPVSFWKMHGAGNDFALFDERTQPLGLTPARIAALCHRQTGIGCDQLVTLHNDPEADVFIRFFNPDGSESGACGNASRCVADVLHRETGRTELMLRTQAGFLPARRLEDGRFQVDMGEPRLEAAEIPLAEPADTLYLPIEGDPAGCSMGNPHATWFVENAESATPALGAQREHHPLFPQRANIGFAQILDPGRIRLKVWERGAGFTLACGSGACATLVNAHRRGLTGRQADIIADGGTLTIAWAANNHVLMAGPTAWVFQGTIELDGLPA